MKIRWIITSIVSFVIAALLYVFVISDWFEKAYNSAAYFLSDDEQSLLQEGDIILRKGYGFVSRRIVDTLKDTLDISHCGIIVKTGSAWSVVHAVPGRFTPFSTDDGVVVVPLTVFIEEAYPNSIIISRLKYNAQEKMAKKALVYAQRKTPFDYDFNLNDSTALYCSELILRILEDEFLLNPDMLGVKENLPLFSVFINHNFFKIIVKKQ